MKSWLLILGFAAAAVPAWAQKPAPSGTSIMERRDQLARDMEGMADGDPLTRVATMEAILQRGDASGAYVAIRSAFASDDPALKNIALRAWIAGVTKLNLTVSLPSDLQKQVDVAMLDPKQASDLLKGDTWLTRWARRSFVVSLGISDVDLGKSAGKVVSYPGFGGQRPEDFTIAGNQIFMTVAIDFTGVNVFICHLTLSPNRSLELEGRVGCDFGFPSPQLRVSTPMF